jgi:hypothetical protein
MTEAWLSPDKTGERRPTVRATIQYINFASYPYDDVMSTQNVRGQFWTGLFSQPADVLEIPAIDSISWSRGVTQDVAECTLRLKANDLTPIGQPQNDEGLYDDPGALIPTRGIIWDADRWGFTANGWEDVFLPNRLVRTYEGYGVDRNVFPAQDTHLKQSGTWLIDEVTFGSDGVVELKMRDFGKILLEKIVMYPGIPYNHYPLTFATSKSVTYNTRVPKGGSWKRPTGSVSSSGEAYVGKNIATSDGSNFVGPGGVWAGNQPSFALNSDPNRVWISTGNSERLPDGPKVWWQVDLSHHKTTIAGVRINPVRGPVRVYISLYDSVKKKWTGTKTIPYHRPTEGVDVGAAIPFQRAVTVNAEEPTDLIFNRPRKNISKVRLTFRPSTIIGSDRDHAWRAGMREVFLYTGARSKLKVSKSSATRNEGLITDYTDAVKWLLGWGGFYWPPNTTQGDYQILDDQGTRQYISFTSADSALPAGRIWGDFMNSGTSPVQDLTADLFDKQPLMDAIGYIRDVLGFVCWVDETGGFIWRMPNIWKPGNYMSPDDLGPRASSKTTSVVEISDENVLLSYSTTIDAKNLREKIFVANTDGRYAQLAAGYGTSEGIDFGRLAGYMDQNFASQAEVERMADLIATRQKFSYRTSRATIPGYPAIQIDDQVRISDRTTNETYYHYVESISSALDMTNGTWDYNLQTHWLGEQASGSWVIDTGSVTNELWMYLHQLGLA